jgi:hypothetical protein
VIGVKIEVCIDVDASDMALLLMLARQENMPLDALIKTAIAQYVALKLASPQTTKVGEK